MEELLSTATFEVIEDALVKQEIDALLEQELTLAIEKREEEKREEEEEREAEERGKLAWLKQTYQTCRGSSVGFWASTFNTHAKQVIDAPDLSTFLRLLEERNDPRGQSASARTLRLFATAYPAETDVAGRNLGFRS